MRIYEGFLDVRWLYEVLSFYIQVNIYDIVVVVQLHPSGRLNLSYKFVHRVAVATRFQRAFMQLLYDAQFEELSARDLMLTSALNTDYLLTLPVYVDWKRASESNAIIFGC